jgi:hypothetical protein
MHREIGKRGEGCSQLRQSISSSRERGFIYKSTSQGSENVSENLLFMFRAYIVEIRPILRVMPSDSQPLTAHSARPGLHDQYRHV